MVTDCGGIKLQLAVGNIVQRSRYQGIVVLVMKQSISWFYSYHVDKQKLMATPCSCSAAHLYIEEIQQVL